jgi:hypothetical protein
MATIRAEDTRHVDSDLVRAHAALASLTHAKGAAGDAGQGPDLARYERLAERMARRMATTIRTLDGLIDRRDELRGRLKGYHVLHQRSLHGHSEQGEEDLTVDALYLSAHQLLQATPCDVRAAEAAVDAYMRRIDCQDPERQGPGGACAS